MDGGSRDNCMTIDKRRKASGAQPGTVCTSISNYRQKPSIAPGAHGIQGRLRLRVQNGTIGASRNGGATAKRLNRPGTPPNSFASRTIPSGTKEARAVYDTHRNRFDHRSINIAAQTRINSRSGPTSPAQRARRDPKSETLEKIISITYMKTNATK